MTHQSHQLHLVYPHSDDLKQHPAIQVAFNLSGSGWLDVSFDIAGQAPVSNDKLGKDESQWGLWDWDVVEVFLRTSSSKKYFEFQVSPLNQFFELEIFEPRVKVNKEFCSGFKHTAAITAAGWKATLSLPLEKLEWDEKKTSLVGNAFAVLGANPKAYWSLFLPHQTRPDFHLPQFFKALPLDGEV